MAKRKTDPWWWNTALVRGAVMAGLGYDRSAWLTALKTGDVVTMCEGWRPGEGAPIHAATVKRWANGRLCVAGYGRKDWSMGGGITAGGGWRHIEPKGVGEMAGVPHVE